ncbi:MULTISPECIES: GmrSD restriction endonuclease domain-containing protein [Anabaena]|nr:MULTISPECIES: DUF262 domain-containing protein [Anabaena]MCM2405064.1 DUF262 domain-containing protein [Anabaena sp. CCAP 1446/1C]
MSITEAYRSYRSGNLLVNRKYQRKLVWTVEEKSRLIGSILKGYPIPLILLAERPKIHGSGKYEVIDGIQRLNAICSFIENSFSFEEKYFDVKEFSFAKQLADHSSFETVNDNNNLLSPRECSNILDYQLAVTIYTAMEEEDITEVFGRINSNGKHLSNQEKRQAGITTAFAEVVRTIAMKLRGDDSQKILNLYEMPEISIDSRPSYQGYGIKAEDTLWCKQGILTISKLRDSEDEDMIADIAASILLSEPLARSRENLDNLYDRESRYFETIENSLALYTAEKLQDNIIKNFSIIRETIESYSSETKCLLNIVNPGSNNPIPQAFYTIFMAFFDLTINQELLPSDTTSIIKSLMNLQRNLNLSKRYATTRDRKTNIDSTKGRIRDYFVKPDRSTLGHGVELTVELENSIRRSYIETTKYECKQGLLDLSENRKLNKDLLQRLIDTICGIANLGSDSEGYIFIGVADKESDVNRIENLDNIKAIELNRRYIVGIDREARIFNQSLEDYVKVLTNAVLNSELTEPLKTQVLANFDIVLYKKQYSVVRITVPRQNEVSFVGNRAFIRKGSSTIEVQGKELLAISKNFNK